MEVYIVIVICFLLNYSSCYTNIRYILGYGNHSRLSDFFCTINNYYADDIRYDSSTKNVLINTPSEHV